MANTSKEGSRPANYWIPKERSPPAHAIQNNGYFRMQNFYIIKDDNYIQQEISNKRR
jgi:hypothetical protein